MAGDRTPEPGNYGDFGADNNDAGTDVAVAFGLIWLFLLGPLIGFGFGIATSESMLTVAIWFGGTIVVGIIGYVVGK